MSCVLERKEKLVAQEDGTAGSLPVKKSTECAFTREIPSSTRRVKIDCQFELPESLRCCSYMCSLNGGSKVQHEASVGLHNWNHNVQRE
jgi:hypothetical protein